MTVEKIYIGGWFQRTTLHLTEVWDFLKYNQTRLDFSKPDLEKARAVLEVKEVSRESGLLEYIQVTTESGIEFRFYEDGLIILEKEVEELKKDIRLIKDYYDEKLSKSLAFIFSKGAPVPKELASIKSLLPYILTTREAKEDEVKALFSDFSEEIYTQVETKNVEVYRSPGMILINGLKDKALIREIVESEIFFREFKAQLHRYLVIHRTIWEKIEKVKEKRSIKGSDIDKYRSELSVYQKTINLIDARIEQMDTYISTRQRVTGQQQIDDYLKPLFDFKFETLQDSLEYIKDLWGMTKNYLDSAIELFGELQAQSTKNTISSLQLVTSLGVVSGLLGYFALDTLPEFTSLGFFYFIFLAALALLVNGIVSRFYRSKRYTIEGKDFEKNIR